MGIEYALADDRKKRLFELGKGPWGHVFGRDDKLLFPSRAMLLAQVLAVMGQDPKLSGYWMRVAEKLWTFIDEAGGGTYVRLVNDTGYELIDLEDKGYQVVGTRYEAPVGEN